MRNLCLHDENYDLSYTVDATRHHVNWNYRSNFVRLISKYPDVERVEINNELDLQVTKD
jgi:hypothetical protein